MIKEFLTVVACAFVVYLLAVAMEHAVQRRVQACKAAGLVWQHVDRKCVPPAERRQA